MASSRAGSWHHRWFSPWVIALTVGLVTFIEVTDMGIANVAFPSLAALYSVSLEQITPVLTSYLIAYALGLPIGGLLSGRFNNRHVYLGCLFFFTVSSLLCFLAPGLRWLVFWRAIQGLGGGALAPSGLTILSDTFSPQKRGLAFAVYSIAVFTSHMIGALLGGYITDNLYWSWVYGINVPFCILSLFVLNRTIAPLPLEAQNT